VVPDIRPAFQKKDPRSHWNGLISVLLAVLVVISIVHLSAIFFLNQAQRLGVDRGELVASGVALLPSSVTSLYRSFLIGDFQNDEPQSPHGADAPLRAGVEKYLKKALPLQCQAILWPLPHWDPDQPSFFNPRAAADIPKMRTNVSEPQTRTLLRNATILTGDNDVVRQNGDVFMEHGIIRALGPDLIKARPDLLGIVDRKVVTTSGSESIRVVNVNELVVTPGLVDMHSHMGLEYLPEFRNAEDFNEGSFPVTSQVRVIDAFTPHDASIALSLAGGVTTSLVLPGSSNAMGGEAIVVKHRRLSNNNVNQMMVEPDASLFGHASSSPSKLAGYKPWRYMKMAMGENVKHSTGMNLRL
jgi:hypothetical protein